MLVNQKIIDQFQIKNLNLFYEGAHNITYQGLINQKIVQVRISKNNIVNHYNEILFLKNNPNTIYIDENVLIRYWHDGIKLSTNNLETLIKIKDVLKKHWALKIPGITLFDPSIINNKDLVLSHGDLRKKNIIYQELTDDIFLIDFEWVNYNSKYFDLAHLHLYCDFSIKDLVDVFNIKTKELIQAIKKVKMFNLKWEKEIYIN